jgi:hypothetical protein
MEGAQSRYKNGNKVQASGLTTSRLCDDFETDERCEKDTCLHTIPC